jgi:isoleucyl-tRNA synthetase
MLSEWYEDKNDKVYLTEEDARAGGEKYKHTVGKMSKSKRNYREPQEIFDRYGADALRWYFFANQAPWTSIRYSERSIKDSIPEFMLRLWNVYSFFVIYARIDEFDPAVSVDGTDLGDLNSSAFANGKGYRPVNERSELDRWIMSELHRTIADVTNKMDVYDNFGAAGALNAFVDGLSNWYVRRSRDRYWAKDKNDQAKLDAYWTLYECLLSTTKLIAPFTPFLADGLWQNLAGTFEGRTTSSVHLCDYPASDNHVVDQALSEQMRLAREISSLGRAARMNAKLKVRQPLANVEVVLADDAHLEWLRAHASLVAEELNVREVNFTLDAAEYIQYQVKPNFKKLGPLLGKNMPEVKKLLSAADGGELLSQLESNGEMQLTLADDSAVTLTREHVEVEIQAKEGWAASQGRGCVVVLSTDLTPELIRSGYANDLVRFIQERRKAMDLDYTDRILVGIENAGDEVKKAIEENAEFIAGETLADKVQFEAIGQAEAQEYTLGDTTVSLTVAKA